MDDENTEIITTEEDSSLSIDRSEMEREVIHEEAEIARDWLHSHSPDETGISITHGYANSSGYWEATSLSVQIYSR